MNAALEGYSVGGKTGVDLPEGKNLAALLPSDNLIAACFSGFRAIQSR